MREKTLHNASLAAALTATVAGISPLVFPAPPSPCKAATTSEGTAHEHDGERDAPRDNAAGDTFISSSSTEAASMIVENGGLYAGPFGTFRIIG